MLLARFLLPLIVALSMILAGCGSQAGQPTAERTGPLKVVATTGQLADAITNVAGDKVELTALLGPGIDPHTYVATEGDVNVIQSADVIVYNGLHLEAQMERIFEQLAKSGQKTVVAVGDQLDQTTLLGWEPEKGFPHDPHIWNDVRLWKQVVEVIRDALIKADPVNSAVYSSNTTAYLGQLDELQTYLTAEAAKIPIEQRVLVTAHDAFNYFGRAYGLKVAAVQGVSTEAEASTADIQALTKVIIDNNVPAIFVETTISPRTIEAVQAAVQATGREVALGGKLYSDAMGEPGSDADTYIKMMRHNIDTIVKALS
jgi:manganese/zinc/iron transport system substrate-binding protein